LWLIYPSELAGAGGLMKFETNYALKLFFSNSSFVQIFYEAVANALDADADKIQISIHSDGRLQSPDIQITIRDNGVGLTEERYERFSQVKEPEDEHHKGLGRLIYLQYFSEIRVHSVYGRKKREFTFVHNFDGTCRVTNERKEEQGTTFVFNTFRGEKIKSYDDLKPGSLRKLLLEQFLPILYDRKLT
jgi:signal transduction histidine kinase